MPFLYLRRPIMKYVLSITFIFILVIGGFKLAIWTTLWTALIVGMKLRKYDNKHRKTH